MIGWVNGLTGEVHVLGNPPSTWTEREPLVFYPVDAEVFTGHSGAPRISINSGKLPERENFAFPIDITVNPVPPEYGTGAFRIASTLDITPIFIPLKDATLAETSRLIGNKIETFFDDTRELKTLVNFGNDFQTLITDWAYSGSQTEDIRVKLYQSLPDEVNEKTTVWISRELASPVIDKLFVTFTPTVAPKVYLRPANKSIDVAGLSGAKVNNASMATLLSSSSFDVLRPSDRVVEEWFTDDVNSTELNIDYTDFSNFVFFGSAESRLDAFVQKLRTLEVGDATLTRGSASLTGTGSAFITGSMAYSTLQSIATQRLDVIRSFDAFERFLYYGSGSAYSASVLDTQYYRSDATYPKVAGIPVPLASASIWYSEMTAIASAYDAQNHHALTNSLPKYVLDDAESDEFVTLVKLMGHQFDTLKGYIDNMRVIYDRNSDSRKGISPDIAWNVGESFGVNMPNQYAIKTLVDYTVGELGSVSPTVYRDAAAETWKRFLHNQIFLMKTKGTKTSLRTLANSYGILPTLLQIRESVTPGVGEPTNTFEVYEEQTNALSLTSGSYLTIPWTTASVSASTLEVRFSTMDSSGTRILVQGGNAWSLAVQPLSGSWGRVLLQSASVPKLSSSFMQLYSGDFYSTMVRYSPSGMELFVKRAEHDDIVEESHTVEASASVAPMWYVPSAISLGASSSVMGTPITGLVDEFRTWGEFISESVFDLHVKYPGLYNGNTIVSARDVLYTRLSFNKPTNLGASATASLVNESPYARRAGTMWGSVLARGFANVPAYPNSMTVISRDVLRYTPNAGGNNFSTNKVIVGDAPVLRYLSGSTVPVLSHNKSIVPLSVKRERPLNNNVVGFYFSLTDAINDSIIRTIGNIDLQNLIGDPSDQYSENYAALTALNKLYWENYAYAYNVNSFVDFVKNLLDPLFKQARELIPARAKLLSGIVHEPHILERSKVTVRPLEVSAGTLTRREKKETHNLEAVPVYTNPTTADSTFNTLATVVSVTDDAQSLATVGYYETKVQTEDFATPVASYATYTGTITPKDTSLELSSVSLVLDDSTNLLALKRNLLSQYGVSSSIQLSAAQLAEFLRRVQQYKTPINIREGMQGATEALSGSETSNYNVATVVYPYSNFDKLESRFYFANANGVVLVPQIQYTRVNQAIIRNRGTWVPGTVYLRDDYIIQSGSTDSAAVTGDNHEFVCITMQSPFLSVLPPYLDTKNWKAMTYKPIRAIVPRKAIVVSGSVSIAPTGSTMPAATGYRPEHYKFSRDYRLGIIRHQWVGCVQTSATTTDGHDPVEITHSSGDSLIVRNPSAPIQSSTNQGGPILDVT
jgi:hypothetical protein